MRAIRLVFVLLVLFAALPAWAQPPRTKIVLDTDIGTDIDDAWALGYVLKSPSLELLGVTIGDGDTARRARLACKLLARLVDVGALAQAAADQGVHAAHAGLRAVRLPADRRAAVLPV